MGWLHLGVFLLCASCVCFEPCAVGETNRAAIPYLPPSLMVQPNQPSEMFAVRLMEEVTANEGRVFDRFASPSARLSWARKQARLTRNGIEDINNDAAGMFTTIGLDSLREAAVELLPFKLWEDYWEGRLAEFIAGSIGNTDEERLELTSISNLRRSPIPPSVRPGNAAANMLAFSGVTVPGGRTHTCICLPKPGIWTGVHSPPWKLGRDIRCWMKRSFKAD
jgi:hypothetical protein